MRHRFSIFALGLLLLAACKNEPVADLLIKNGTVYLGDGGKEQYVEIAITGDSITYIGSAEKAPKAKVEIDASGLIVAPGFIDPHTHSLADLKSKFKIKRMNLNYLFQGVTTVVNGNDGFGNTNLKILEKELSDGSIGTNTAFFIGHGMLRRQIMGHDARAPTDSEMQAMKALVAQAMEDGALGLSTGLFYAPGSFADILEVIDLAKVAASYGGIYDTHIRDESSYNIGVEAAIDEVLTIAEQANISAHISHIKALGVDVWGKSEPIISKIEAARAQGLDITANQYPWSASGTRISNALLPRWLKADGTEAYFARLSDASLYPKIVVEVNENLRRRGGADSILITEDRPAWRGRKLSDLAEEKGVSAVEMAISIAKAGDAKIASFNMSDKDIENFMVQEWVMTGSDGDRGHPRKFASYPRKYEVYVKEKKLISLSAFIHRSAGMVAETFNLCKRGFLREGWKADIIMFHPDKFKALADFQYPEVLAAGIEYVLVNGVPVIQEGAAQNEMAGRVLHRCNHQNKEG